MMIHFVTTFAMTMIQYAFIILHTFSLHIDKNMLQSRHVI